MCYYFVINGIFSILSIWCVYFLSQKKAKEVEQKHEKENDIQSIQNIETPKPLEINEGNIYVGEIISLEEYKNMNEDSKTWYNNYQIKIQQSLSEMNKLFNNIE